MPSRAVIAEFLEQPTLAFVGVSRDGKQFANSVFRALRSSGHTVVPIHREAAEVEGEHAYRSLDAVPFPVGGVVVMVPPTETDAVVRSCVDAGVPRVWLHRGAGMAAVSDTAVAYCRDHGVAVVDGACPLMFLEPVGLFHRMHRGMVRSRLSA